MKTRQLILSCLCILFSVTTFADNSEDGKLAAQLIGVQAIQQEVKQQLEQINWGKYAEESTRLVLLFTVNDQGEASLSQVGVRDQKLRQFLARELDKLNIEVPLLLSDSYLHVALNLELRNFY